MPPRRPVPKRWAAGAKNWRVLSASESTSFVTLKIGRSVVKTLFNKANKSLLTWLGDTTLSYEQKIRTNVIIKERDRNRSEDIVSKSNNANLQHADSGAALIASANAAVASLRHPEFFTKLPHTSLRATECTSEISSRIDEDGDVEMNPPSQPRPSLKLKLSSLNTQQTNTDPETPNPQSAVRTPSIKLNFGPKSATAASPPAVEDVSTPSSTKKRKRPSNATETPVAKGAPKPPAIRKLSLFTSQTPKVSNTTPGIRLKTRGKVPKRPLGVGYDSELEEREADPVILEAFVLRMLPGPDCDYIRESLDKGLVGVSRLQGGADIRMRFLDSHGRRGVMFVRGNQYAISIVDLPTITEGMKSWDKKNFMKSVDISQMCLVLGPCKNDDEARDYKLPPEVNPKNYQYAHGLTAPMKNVRKRRYERTTRARVDDIEHVEKKVQTLLTADSSAAEVSWEVLDYDPRIKREEFSPEYDSEQDAEAEEDSYFPNGATAETPDYASTPGQQAAVTAEDVEDYEKLFEIDADDGGTANGDTSAISLLRPDASDSPAVTSSVSPSATAAPTPAGEDDAESSDEDEEEDEDADDERREGDDQRSQTLDRIRDIENTIRESKEQLKKLKNPIFLRKHAQKITNLQKDVDMMKQSIGMDVDGEGED